MSPTAPDFDDDTSSQLGRAARAARDVPSDPGGAIRELAVSVLAHEQLDERRWRMLWWAAGVIVSASLGVGAWAWTAQANSGADRARLEDVQARLGRIEQQIDRLLARQAQ